MAVFYWENNGRLGNFLFQYAAILRHTSTGDRVYAFHNEVFDLLEIDPRFILIRGTGARTRQINFHTNRLASFVARIGLLGSLTPALYPVLGYPTESDRVLRVAGLMRNLFVVQGFFQHGRAHYEHIRIKPSLIEIATARLASIAKARPIVAIHIRLSDYGNWSVLGQAGVLVPAKWYRDRIDELRERLNTPAFLVFSDDIQAARELQLGNDVSYFHGKNSLEDFTVMALCDHAVVSPSSFAWWSAFAIRADDKIVMAPTYWAGFKSDTWYPPTIVTEGVEYYPVL